MINNEKSKGLGDTVAKITHALKIDKVAEAAAHLAGIEGCGCEERKEWLNQLFPYKEKYRKFRFLKDFAFGGVIFSNNQVISINSDHMLYDIVINLVKDEVVVEI